MKKEFKKSFSPVDETERARLKLGSLAQTEGVDKYINDFRILASTAGFTDNIILIEYFMKGLHPKLVKGILEMEKPPTMVDEWYTHASRLDAAHQRVKAISNRFKSGGKGTYFLPAPTPKKVGRSPPPIPPEMALAARVSRRAKCT